MCIHMYIYTFEYIYVNIYACIHVCINMYVYMYIHIHIFSANSALQVDRGSSVKVKHYLYEIRVIHKF